MPSNDVNPFLSKRLIAFTLAEVLIVLGIIGVVAEMTIPTLINSYQKQAYVASLKKTYTQLSQAAKQMSQDYGCVSDLGCTGLFNSPINELAAADAFMKNFKVLKQVNSGQSADFFGSVYRTYEGGSVVSENWAYPFCDAEHLSAGYKYLLADGTAISIIKPNLCSVNNKTPCLSVQVDVNGSKPPNKIGRDFFNFGITANTTVIPAGSSNNQLGIPTWKDVDSYNCTSPLKGDGQKGSYGCTARIIEESWQMNY